MVVDTKKCVTIKVENTVMDRARGLMSIYDVRRAMDMYALVFEEGVKACEEKADEIRLGRLRTSFLKTTKEIDELEKKLKKKS